MNPRLVPFLDRVIVNRDGICCLARIFEAVDIKPNYPWYGDIHEHACMQKPS